MYKHDAQPDAAAGNGSALSASAVDESAYEYYRRTYRDAPYFSSGRAWSDYAPAYRYAMEQVEVLGIDPASFAAIEPRLETGWDAARDGSRLSWPEARGAVRHVFEDVTARRRARASRRQS